MRVSSGNAPSIPSLTSWSIAARNAAKVLPDPVGAATSTLRPDWIAGHAWACAGVGASKVLENHEATAGWKESRTLAIELLALEILLQSRQARLIDACDRVRRGLVVLVVAGARTLVLALEAAGPGHRRLAFPPGFHDEYGGVVAHRQDALDDLIAERAGGGIVREELLFDGAAVLQRQQAHRPYGVVLTFDDLILGDRRQPGVQLVEILGGVPHLARGSLDIDRLAHVQPRRGGEGLTRGYDQDRGECDCIDYFHAFSLIVAPQVPAAAEGRSQRAASGGISSRLTSVEDTSPPSITTAMGPSIS